ncbi:MAG: carboxypeptidase-like regulatory domain-containing protein [Candidatus Omnitrophota bacterium]|nr:carboxypeptidase-like regulatory domain-containing protein [Candidatus Omnitrophota bacterium]
MVNYFEQIAKIIYREWKAANRFTGGDHPDAESLACFLEDSLPVADKRLIQKHALSCDLCAEYLSTQLKIQPHLSLAVPAPLLEKINKLVGQDTRENLFEIFIKLKEKALEIIQTTGDVLLGQELVPAQVLRSRKMNEFKEEVSILKDLQQIRVMAKIQNKSAKSFNLTVTVKDKQGQAMHKNLRITLIKEGIELESYITDSAGSSFFENILPGSYVVEVSREDQKEAVIDLKVRA